MADSNVMSWNVQKVLRVSKDTVNERILDLIRQEQIDGNCILLITESDCLSLRDKYNLKLGELKRFQLFVHQVQERNQLNSFPGTNQAVLPGFNTHHQLISNFILNSANNQQRHYGDSELNFHDLSPPHSIDGKATSIKPELFKTFISLGYAFLVTWITAFVMVVVHERVPDTKRHPPLPDIFLDNVPHIPWAFMGCEVTGTLLFAIWTCVLLKHKHRFVLIRRFFAMGGTVFLLRCVTMLITSLSVPGSHLECRPNEYKFDDTNMTLMHMLNSRISRAYTIWSGLGMSIQGVRTCGDYMFSGHTVALTLLNFFITEYTPRNLYFLHTITWLLNMFGIFFILAAHEHYSIDVFVAFYISSRLFLYYHTLANNQALMSLQSRDRTRIWFPMFSYFESTVDGIIPNEYNTVNELLDKIGDLVTYVKDVCMLTARRIWIEQQPLVVPKKRHLKRSGSQSLSRKNLAKMQSAEQMDQKNVHLRRSLGNLTDDLVNNNNENIVPNFKKEHKKE